MGLNGARVQRLCRINLLQHSQMKAGGDDRIVSALLICTFPRLLLLFKKKPCCINAQCKRQETYSTVAIDNPEPYN